MGSQVDGAAALKGKRILIAGGLGFLGSNLAHALVSAGVEDIAIVDALVPGHGGLRFNVAGIEDRVEVHQGDVRDRELCVGSWVAGM